MPKNAKCTLAKMRRVARWEHEGVLDAMQRRLDQQPIRGVGALIAHARS
ncbi:MAG TPA: hypothetical protein VEX11_11070 [Acetobacteraceae bacterium]|nr:hypothetical protein [Acetobacteraceae bacterium]